jgi:hypothetical protein
MGKLIEFAKFKKQQEIVQPPQVVAAHMVVEDLRATLYALPSDKARIELAMMVLSQIVMWVCRSNHYDNPGEFIKTWVNRKVALYTKKEVYK